MPDSYRTGEVASFHAKSRYFFKRGIYNLIEHRKMIVENGGECIIECIQQIQQLRERSLLLIYSSRFIVDLKVYSIHRQQSLGAHSTVESAKCTQ